tara:strand:- start:893 stop:1471 length:579 start_codon:yes stop_codon:yes gene_type:complete
MTSIYKCNGKTIRPGQQFTDADGTTHPGSWFTYSVEQKTAIGITEIVQQPHPNSVLYNWSYNDDGTVTSTAKALDDVNEVDENGDPLLDDDGVQVVTKGVRSNLIAEVKSQQGSLLSETDWAVIRNADTEDAIPANIATYRAAIRTKATAMEAAITDAADTDAVAALFVTYTVEDDDSITKSGILYDWPELG